MKEREDQMGKKVIIIEESDGWYIFDGHSGDELEGGISSREESIRISGNKAYELPAMNANGSFFTDMDGRPLYITRPGKSGELELEYTDETPCLDFEICALCKGPAFGRDSPSKRRNCYYCPSCEKDVDCVPSAELIGALD